MKDLKLIINIIFKFTIFLFILIHHSVSAQNIDLSNYVLANTTNFSFIDDNLSGITYNRETNTLFMVQNKPTNIYEVDLDGSLKRTITLIGFEDTEGIVHLSGNRFAVTEERLGRVVFINMNANTTQINYSSADIVQLPTTLTPTSGASNDGLEGLSYNASTNEIITTREYKQREGQNKGYFVFKVPSSFPTTLSENEVEIVCEFNNGLRQLRDFAGIHYTGKNSLVLSEGEGIANEKLLIEIDQNCNEVSKLSLSNTNQPEGVTMSNDGTLYIAGEKNTLYKFVKELDCVIAANGNGDVNLDGVTNLIDAMMIIRFSSYLIEAGDCGNLNPPEELCLAQADMNCDGKVTIGDALLITQCNVGINNSYCPN